MEKFKKFMSSPYTRGDYYGGIAVAIACYAVGIGISYVLAKRSEREFYKSFNDEVIKMNEDLSEN